MIGQTDLDHRLYYIHELNSNFKENNYFVNTVLNCKELNVDIDTLN